MTAKRALICGVTGQDGAYLARFLLNRGYTVFGTSRDAQASNLSNLSALGVAGRISLLSMAPKDFRSVLTAVSESEADEIYYLSGQSSVGLSYGQPAETIESIVMGALNLLETCRFLDKPVKFYNAGSSECFGDLHGTAATEESPFQPKSPYAVAKSSAHWLTANYRDGYGLFACTGILFNHESPLRPARFVTRKIVATACRISRGSKEKLRLGRVDVFRDWGWAEEYVEAMWMMLQRDTPDDFVIATGKSFSIEDFVECAFSCVGLNYRDYLESDSSLFRPTDIAWSQGNANRAKTLLGWEAKWGMKEVVREMVRAELDATSAYR